MRLIRRLVLREPHVPVRPEHLRRAELRLQRGRERLQRRLHLLVVDPLVRRPERLGVVGLQILVEVQRRNRDTGETHLGTLSTGHYPSRAVTRRISRNSPAPVSSARASPSGAQPAETRKSRVTTSASGTQARTRDMPSPRAWSVAAASSRQPWPRRPHRGSTRMSASSPVVPGSGSSDSRSSAGPSAAKPTRHCCSSATRTWCRGVGGVRIAAAQLAPATSAERLSSTGAGTTSGYAIRQVSTWIRPSSPASPATAGRTLTSATDPLYLSRAAARRRSARADDDRLRVHVVRFTQRAGEQRRDDHDGRPDQQEGDAGGDAAARGCVVDEQPDAQRDARGSYEAGDPPAVPAAVPTDEDAHDDGDRAGPDQVDVRAPRHDPAGGRVERGVDQSGRRPVPAGAVEQERDEVVAEPEEEADRRDRAQTADVQ